ncbi:MAG TPA: hypothetical protein VF103_04750 [Polyangiaceae bacterium]
MKRARVFAAVGLLSLVPPPVEAAPPIRGAVGRAGAPFEPVLSARSARDRALIAYHFAPVHYQAVDRDGTNGLEGRADFVTRVDFDGDWDGRNDWENAARFPLPGAAYYSVVETATHWFAVYMFFHPRDWANSLFDTEHENDSEGMLLAIARDGSRFGRLEAAVTVVHSDFFSFLPVESRWAGGGESVDGVLELDAATGRPLTTQEARGHALKARQRDAPFDGIVYTPSLVPAPAPNTHERRASYVLVDVFEPGGLWDRRDDPKLFASRGSFAGDRSGGCGSGGILCTENAAHAPWGWDDSDDGDVRPGEMATDPAHLATLYFRVPERVASGYSYNPFLAPRAIRISRR